MASTFDHLTVLITGSASGIGRGLAELLYATDNCRLILVDQDLPGLKALAKQLEGGKKSKPRIKIFRCDISSKVSVEKLLKDTEALELDVLVNNAGVFEGGAFASTAFDKVEKTINVNLLGAMRMTRAFLPKLLAAKRPAIVNVASLAGLVGGPGMCAYSASKFGLVGFSEALASELGERVHVCAVCPTFVKTNIVKDSDTTMDLFLQKYGSSPQKVAQAIRRGVLSRKRLVLVNPDAYALFYAKKFLPRVSEAVVGAAYRRLLKKGVMQP